MKIVLAASIYPPEIGGPAFYTAALKEALEKQGHEAVVVSYTHMRKLPIGIRHAWYLFSLLRSARKADGIIAFDTFAAGAPVAIVSILTRVPAAVRIGGDALWERYVARTNDLVTLPGVYQKRAYWNWKERMTFQVTKWVLHHTAPVFTTCWLMDIWRGQYAFEEVRAHMIENAIEEKLSSKMPVRKNFIFYSRQIALKNHAAFRRAFARAKERYPEIELEEGMVSHEELLQKMRTCYAAVLPSISDVTPNYIIDALRCGKPFLITKYSGYAESFPGCGVVIDPFDEADMTKGIERLADMANYEAMQKCAASFAQVHSYADIADEFIALFSSPSR